MYATVSIVIKYYYQYYHSTIENLKVAFLVLGSYTILKHTYKMLNVCVFYGETCT